MDEQKLNEVKEVIIAAIKEALDDPRFDYDLENPSLDNMLVMYISRSIYPLVDLDYFRSLRYQMLKDEIRLIESQMGVKE